MELNDEGRKYLFEGNKDFLKGISIIKIINPNIKCNKDMQPDYSIYNIDCTDEKRNYIIISIKNKKYIFFFDKYDFILGFKTVCSKMSINHNDYIEIIHISW